MFGVTKMETTEQEPESKDVELQEEGSVVEQPEPEPYRGPATQVKEIDDPETHEYFHGRFFNMANFKCPYCPVTLVGNDKLSGPDRVDEHIYDEHPEEMVLRNVEEDE